MLFDSILPTVEHLSKLESILSNQDFPYQSTISMFILDSLLSFQQSLQCLHQEQILSWETPFFASLQILQVWFQTTAIK